MIFSVDLCDQYTESHLIERDLMNSYRNLDIVVDDKCLQVYGEVNGVMKHRLMVSVEGHVFIIFPPIC